MNRRNSKSPFMYTFILVSSLRRAQSILLALTVVALFVDFTLPAPNLAHYNTCIVNQIHIILFSNIFFIYKAVFIIICVKWLNVVIAIFMLYICFPGKSLPVHCVVETVTALGYRRRPVVETDSYVIIPVCTAFADLVGAALLRLGYPPDCVAAARGKRPTTAQSPPSNYLILLKQQIRLRLPLILPC